MKKFLKKIILLSALAFIFTPSFTTIYAQTAPGTLTGYEVLVQLPGIGDTGTNKTDLSLYLPAAFNLTVGIAVALAFVMITFGGVLYATSDAISNKSLGKEYILNALFGLLLVIGSYVILYTINPQILKFNLILPIPTPATAVVTLGKILELDATGLASDTAVRNQLLGAGITINKLACKPGETIPCTNVNGLPQPAIDGLISLRGAPCNCRFVITGGTENGHATHGPKIPIVDIRPNTGLNKYIWNSVNNPPDKTNRKIKLPNGSTASFTYETLGGNVRGTSTGPHWHVVIN